jgi:acyl-CoA thioester hydrolase
MKRKNGKGYRVEPTPGARYPAPVPALDDATRQAFGVEGPWWFGVRHRVRWSEVDPFGHANHAAFLEWCEEARNQYLEAIGIPRLSATTPGPILIRLEVEYRAPVRYGQEVLVTARTRSFRRTSLETEYAVWEQGLAATCTAVFVLMVSATGERVPIPPSVVDILVIRDGARPALARDA